MSKFIVFAWMCLICTSCIVTNRTASIPEEECYAHSEEFKKRISWINYGIACPPTIKDSIDYPYPKKVVCGGCVVSIKKFAVTKYCPICEKTKKGDSLTKI